MGIAIDKAEKTSVGALRQRARRAGCWAVVCLLVVVQPALAQRKSKDKPAVTQPTSATAKPGETSLVRAEEEASFADGMRYIMTDEPTKAISQFQKIIEKDPTNGAAQYAVGAALLKAGKVTEALPYSTKAYQLDKNNKYYTLLLAELYVKQKRYAEAEDLYESLLKRGTENVEYGVELAAIYLFDDKPDKALQTYDKVEQAMGMNEEITHQKQRIYLKQNKVDAAVAEAEKLVAAEPGDPAYLLEGAELLIANERIPQAINWIEKALKLNPDNAQAHVLLADIYRKQGNQEKYNQELKYVFESPNLEASVKARLLTSFVGGANDDAKSKQEALRLAQDLVKSSPNEPKSQVMLADLLMQQGQKTAARSAYLKAAQLDPSVYEVWGAILQIDGDLNQLDSLLAHSEKALEVFPTQGLFWYSNGAAHLGKKHYQQAVDALEESRKLSAATPDLVKFINAQLGDAYNGLGDNVKSDAAYETVLKEEPLNDHVLNNYSYFLSLRKENLPRARQLAEQLIKQHPDNATYLDTYAWVLFVMKDYARAKTVLEKALGTDPTAISGTLLEHYGDILYQLNERDKAIEQWKKAKTKGETSPQLDKKIATGKLYE